MSQPSHPEADAQRASDELRRQRRDAVASVAERNRLAHVEARKQRQEADRRRNALRGPDDR